jgi:hypothetical protein
LNHLAVAILEIFRSEALVADVVLDGVARALGERQDEDRIATGQLQLVIFLPVIGLRQGEAVLNVGAILVGHVERVPDDEVELAGVRAFDLCEGVGGKRGHVGHALASLHEVIVNRGERAREAFDFRVRGVGVVDEVDVDFAEDIEVLGAAQRHDGVEAGASLHSFKHCWGVLVGCHEERVA